MSSRVAVDPAPEQPQKSVAPPDLFCREFPSPKTAVDIFAGEWATRFPPPLQDLTGGQHDPIDDGRIRWGAERFGGVGGMRVLELGPLEGAHTYTLDRLGAREVVAVEANQRAFLRCLVAKEILGIPSARFLCGDFVKLLEGGPPSDGRWDLCVAVGVLYHQQDPVKLLDLITRSSDRVLLWTHYYDDAAMSSRPELKARYVPLPATTGGFNYTLHRQYYGESVQQKGFCGGIEVWSGWMERDEILACLEHFNFEVLSVEFDEPNHQNGPAFCVAARRSGIRDDEAS